MLESLFDKVAGLKAQHKCLAANIAKFLRTYFFVKHLQWLFLYVKTCTLVF